MDERTLAAYDREAAAFAREWSAQPVPSDMQALLRRFFRPGPTADIGCRSGRDVAWLNRNGFPAIGYDACEGLLAEARRLHPDLRFHQAALPELKGIADNVFANVLCETVIMHLDPRCSARRKFCWMNKATANHQASSSGGSSRGKRTPRTSRFRPSSLLESAGIRLAALPRGRGPYAVR